MAAQGFIALVLLMALGSSHASVDYIKEYQATFQLGLFDQFSRTQLIQQFTDFFSQQKNWSFKGTELEIADTFHFDTADKTIKCNDYVLRMRKFLTGDNDTTTTLKSVSYDPDIVAAKPFSIAKKYKDDAKVMLEQDMHWNHTHFTYQVKAHVESDFEYTTASVLEKVFPGSLDALELSADTQIKQKNRACTWSYSLDKLKYKDYPAGKATMDFIYNNCDEARSDTAKPFDGEVSFKIYSEDGKWELDLLTKSAKLYKKMLATSMSGEPKKNLVCAA
eukprot:Colp12_sorted_trinity150504_noHs@27090